MTRSFGLLDEEALLSLARKLEDDPARFPFSPSDVYHYAPNRRQRETLAAAFTQMHELGMTPAAAAWSLRTIVEERRMVTDRAPVVTPVWSGLDVEGRSHRAPILMRDLFAEARERVWISFFNIDDKHKSGPYFKDLAARYDREELSVRLYVNIKRNRDWHKGKSDEWIVDSFRNKFRDQVWVGTRLPEVYYDPRALNVEGSGLACLHAKTIMIDESKVLITSANFSEAAQIRNIEAGVVIEDKLLTQTYCRNFQRLVDQKLLVQLEFG